MRLCVCVCLCALVCVCAVWTYAFQEIRHRWKCDVCCRPCPWVARWPGASFWPLRWSNWWGPASSPGRVTPQQLFLTKLPTKNRWRKIVGNHWHHGNHHLQFWLRCSSVLVLCGVQVVQDLHGLIRLDLTQDVLYLRLRVVMGLEEFWDGN